MSTSIEGGWSSEDKPLRIRVRVGRPVARPGEKHQGERGGGDTHEFGDEKNDRERDIRSCIAGGGSVSVIRHHAYWAIMAKLPAIMKARPAATGFGQIAAQMKKSSQRHQRWLTGRGQEKIVEKGKHGLQLSEIEPLRCGRLPPLSARAERVLVSEGDRSGSPDRAPGRTHVIHGDRDVEGALAQIDRRDGEIRRRSGGAGQIDDGPVIGLAVLERSKRCGASDLETIVDSLIDIRADDRVRAVEHAHEVLTLVHELAGTDQHLPNPAHRRQSDRRFGTEPKRASSSAI